MSSRPEDITRCARTPPDGFSIIGPCGPEWGISVLLSCRPAVYLLALCAATPARSQTTLIIASARPRLDA